MSSSNPQGSPLRSEYADDADMADIVRVFVEEMPARVDALKQCWESQAMEDLHRLAHQLKGAGGGYGFSALGLSAGKLEGALESLARNSGEASAATLRKSFEDLINLCKRVSH